MVWIIQLFEEISCYVHRGGVDESMAEFPLSCSSQGELKEGGTEKQSLGCVGLIYHRPAAASRTTPQFGTELSSPVPVSAPNSQDQRSVPARAPDRHAQGCKIIPATVSFIRSFTLVNGELSWFVKKTSSLLEVSRDQPQARPAGGSHRGLEA